MTRYLRIDLLDMTVRQTSEEPTPQQLDDSDAVWLRVSDDGIEEWDVGWSEVES